MIFCFTYKYVVQISKNSVNYLTFKILEIPLMNYLLYFKWPIITKGHREGEDQLPRLCFKGTMLTDW